MSSVGTPISEITKIGNYAIPGFGVAITAAIAISFINRSNLCSLDYYILTDFALYSIFSSFVAYCHRLSYLRYRQHQIQKMKIPTNLPFGIILLILFIHVSLIATLAYRLWSHGVV